jgi:hypothetical protein
MKFKDLNTVIERYQSERGFLSARKSNPAIERLVTLYNAEDDKEKDLPEAVIRHFLAYHWQEIKATPRSYLRMQKNIKATEQAYVHLAAFLDSSQAAAPTSYVKIATLMPGIPSYTRNINFKQPMAVVGNRVFHYDAFVDELKEQINIQDLTVISDALKNYDLATVNHLRAALSMIQPMHNQQQAELQKLQNVFTQLSNQFATVRTLQLHPEVLARFPMLLNSVPPRYSFKGQDNFEFDIRCLFFTGFKHPLTGEAFSATDYEKLITHPILGQHIAYLNSINNMFVLPMTAAQQKSDIVAAPSNMLGGALNFMASTFSEIKNAVVPSGSSFSHISAVDFREFDFRAFSERKDGIPPMARQGVSHHLTTLLTLSGYLQEDNFLQNVSADSEVKRSMTKFASDVAPFKAKLAAATASIKIPSRYSFKAADNAEFDMRTLFFNSFISPITQQDFSEVDLTRILGLPVLGALITQLKDMNDPFVLPASEGYPAIDFRKFDFKAFSDNRDGIPLNRRQQVYAHISALVELSDHLHFENYLVNIPDSTPLKQDIVKFAATVNPLRKNILWNEMDHAQFFLKARPILDAMKIEMARDWDASTVNFFLAMKEFSEDPEGVVKRANSSYIRSNGEYVVRVPSIAKDVDAVRVLKELVGQFKRSFELAYRDDCLRALMQGMTPTGICIAEKMLHLASSFALRASLGSGKLATLDDVFADVMAKARKYEIARGATWNGIQFLNYIMEHHKGKTAYVDAHGKKQFIGEKEARYYLGDVIGYEDITPYVEPKTQRPRR